MLLYTKDRHKILSYSSILSLFVLLHGLLFRPCLPCGILTKIELQEHLLYIAKVFIFAYDRVKSYSRLYPGSTHFWSRQSFRSSQYSLYFFAAVIKQLTDYKAEVTVWKTKLSATLCCLALKKLFIWLKNNSSLKATGNVIHHCLPQKRDDSLNRESYPYFP